MPRGFSGARQDKKSICKKEGISFHDFYALPQDSNLASCIASAMGIIKLIKSRGPQSATNTCLSKRVFRTAVAYEIFIFFFRYEGQEMNNTDHDSMQDAIPSPNIL